MNSDSLNILNEFIIPHIALTTFKYRAKAACVFKEINAVITIDQFVLLKVLMQFPNITQLELAQMIFKDKSNFSRMADELEKKGCIKRTLDFKGKRVVKRLSITAIGMKHVNYLFPYAQKLHAHSMKDVSIDEMEALKSVLSKIRNNLDNEINLDLSEA